MRVALNHGNPVLAGRTPLGEPFGISVSIAHRLAQHLGLELSFIDYGRAADVSSDAQRHKWDVCFLAFDARRAQTLDFTKPYLQIEGSYLAGSAVTSDCAEDLVASGTPIGCVEGSAYTLTLQRKPGCENLVIFENFQTLVRALDDGRVAAIAGIHAVMQAQADKRPGARVLHPPFMKIRQSMGTPQGRPGAKTELDNWLQTLVQDGTIGNILEEHGVGRECTIK